MNATEEQRKKQQSRPLDNYERRRADEVLIRDGVSETYINDPMRTLVLIKLGLRK